MIRSASGRCRCSLRSRWLDRRRSLRDRRCRLAHSVRSRSGWFRTSYCKRCRKPRSRCCPRDRLRNRCGRRYHNHQSPPDSWACTSPNCTSCCHARCCTSRHSFHSYDSRWRRRLRSRLRDRRRSSRTRSRTRPRRHRRRRWPSRGRSHTAASNCPRPDPPSPRRRPPAGRRRPRAGSRPRSDRRLPADTLSESARRRARWPIARERACGALLQLCFRSDDAVTDQARARLPALTCSASAGSMLIRAGVPRRRCAHLVSRRKGPYACSSRTRNRARPGSGRECHERGQIKPPARAAPSTPARPSRPSARTCAPRRPRSSPASCPRRPWSTTRHA